MAVPHNETTYLTSAEYRLLCVLEGASDWTAMRDLQDYPALGRETIRAIRMLLFRGFLRRRTVGDRVHIRIEPAGTFALACRWRSESRTA